MALIVQKFGGTSVATVQLLENVANKVIRAYDEGNDVVVVLSAMGHETDRLIELAQSMVKEPDPREYAALISTGEQVSISLLAMALLARGYPSRSYTGWQAKIKTNGEFKKARITDIDCGAIREDLAMRKIVVVAGFQGIADCGSITTLGRGGSDTTAVAIAAALNADECHIYTDVDGVYTTDPRVVPNARCLEKITFEEMLEMASLGAEVLQIRSVEFAGKYNIPLRVKSSFNDTPGTLITYEGIQMEHAIVSGIAFNRNEAKLTILGVPDRPGVASAILGPISEAGIEIDMIIQNVAQDETTDFTFTVHRDDYNNAQEILAGIATSLGAREIVGDNKIVKISLVGVGMRSHAGIASTMFRVLGTEGINIRMITTSEIKISVVVDEKYLELAVRALHTAFGLDKVAAEEFDPRK